MLATPVFAQERPTAYQALRTVGTQLNRDLVNHVISVSGSQWRSAARDVDAFYSMTQRQRGGVREVEVSNGKITSERTPLRSAVEGSLGATIDTAKLNLDSSGAYTLAQQTADKSHVTFATADYTLRVDERGNPIWIVALQKQAASQREQFTSAPTTARITRTEGLFSGGDQTAVVDAQTDEAKPENADADDDGDQNGVKGSIKQAFRQAGDDVKRTFFKVRRSFVDFFQDK